MAKPKPLTVANVKYRSIRELADAFGLNYRTVANRINRGGYSPEEAVGLLLPSSSHKRPFTVHGVTYQSVASAARKHGISPVLVHDRLQRGWDPEAAVETGRRLTKRGNKIEIGGRKFLSLKEAAEHFGISYSIVRYRMRKKWSLKQVFGVSPPPLDQSVGAPQSIEFGGKKYPSRRSLSEAFGVNPNKFYKRMKAGWSIEQALEIAPRSHNGAPKRLVINGKSFESRNAAARYYGIDIGTVATRVNKQKWTIEQALELDEPPLGSTTKFGFVYLIKNTDSGKSYVGITRKNYLKRFSEHLRVAEKSRLLNPEGLHAAIRLLGKKRFKIEILAEAKTIGELQRLERKFIKDLSTLSPHGYNLSTGGTMVDLPGRTLEIKSLNLHFDSIAEAARFFDLEGGTVQNRLARGYTPEQAVGLKRLVWKSPDWHPVGIDGHEFSTLRDAAEYFEQPANRVRNRINKGWSVERALKTPKIELSKQIIIKGRSYTSMRSAARALGIHHETLRQRIKSGRDPLTGR